MKRITGSLVVCIGAGVFTTGALFYEPDDRPVASAPVPTIPSATVTYGSGSSGAGAAAPTTLQIADFSFGAVSASPAAAINIVNQDGADHTVTAEGGEFNVKIDGKASGSFTAPAAPGSYEFFCAIHPEMSGTLVIR